MTTDSEVQIISAYGWLDIFSAFTTVRQGGAVIREPRKTPLPELHIHEDGITITGLSPQVIAFIAESVKYAANLDKHGKPTDKPELKTARITIKVDGN